MKRSGRSDFWKLAASTRFLPRETRDYVPLVLAAIVVARNPAQYGMTIWPSVAPSVETVRVNGALDLRRVAEWAGSPVQDIQGLNPELRRWTTPVRTSGYELKVPAGTASVIEARLAELGADELAPLNHYTVKKGDTLSAIAKRLKVSRADLTEANYLTSRSTLQIGQLLIIPRAPALLAARTDSPQATSPQTSDAVLARRDTEIDEAPTPTATTHRVRRGDTLFSIAKRYGTTVARLKELNSLRSNVIQVGQRLLVQPLVALATN
jgi:membrane-bound lytic murein transglycosylase D